MIKEAIFDIDDTLYNYEKGHAAAMKQMERYVWEQFEIPAEEFYTSYKRLQEGMNQRLGMDNAAIHSRNIRIQNMLEEWNKPLFPHIKGLYRTYWDTLLEVSGPEPGAVECMGKLREMGIAIGIGTDMTVGIQYEKLETFGFAPYVSHIVTSQEAGVEKPHREFMELCIRKSGVRPEECIFTGDNFKKDVRGAVESGMHAAWYNAKGKGCPKDAGIPADSYREIRHFDELIPYIKSLG